MASQRQPRAGLSLIELLAVITLLGVFASAALMRFGRDTFADTGARSEARVLSLSLLHAQRAAIRSGNPHAVVFHGSTLAASGWSIVEKPSSGGSIVIEGPHPTPDGLTISTSSPDIWFDFEGVGVQPFTATLRGKNRAFQVDVEPLTRMISTRETTL